MHNKNIKIKKIIAFVLCMAALFTAAVIPGAAVKVKDPDHAVSLDMYFKYDGMPVPGSSFRIYYVANVYVNVHYTVSFALAGSFKKYPVSINGLGSSDWAKTANALYGYVLRDNIAPYDTAVTDANGLAAFPSQRASMDQGLYLVIGDPVTLADGYTYTPQPGIISVPNIDVETQEWIYDVTAAVKYSRETTPDGERKVSKKVIKVWEGDEEFADIIRPESVTIHLYMDTTEYDTVELNEANNWSYEWNNILPDGHRWTVSEDEVEFYVTTIDSEGITFVVNNRYSDTEIPDDPIPLEKLPQTGALRWPVYVLAAGGMLIFLVGLVIYRRHED